MIVWGLSDLHLALARDGGREHIAGRWRDHAARIEAEWRAVVGPGDVVLMPGDVSMARNHRELQADLEWLERLPGRKVLSPGNHDHWWNDVAKIRPMLRPSQSAVDGDAVAVNGVIVCGARSVDVPLDDAGARERADAAKALAKLERALAAALELRTAEQPVFVLWHHPPFDRFKRPGPWVERFRTHAVTAVAYGHLHAEAQWSRAVQGVMDGVRYAFVAADAVGFRPLKVATLP